MAHVAEGSPDRLVRLVSDSGGLAVRTIQAPGMVAECARRHELGALATVTLGRALLGATLLGAGGKDEETVQVRFRGTGPLGHVVAIADCEGRARGYVSSPAAQVPARGGRMDVASGVGFGDLSVVRHRPGWRKPYTGIVPITAGTIAEDLTLYLSESEQTPSAVALGVQLDDDGRVDAAVGYLAQALPAADPDEIARLEDNVRMLAAPSEWIAAGGDARSLGLALLQDLGGRVLDERPAAYHCGCDRERVVRAVALLGREELDQAIRDGETLEVRCEFCNECYAVDPERSRALLADA